MKKQSYDLIGDIHGQVLELVQLLKKLSYSKADGIWQHPNRKVIFLGDFIDRGNYQREVIDIVRPMIEYGHALGVMGNHEYNAIAYHTKDINGHYLRPHNNKHTGQHKAFLAAYAEHPKEKNDVIKWFKSLPLWLEFGNLRVIHACWESVLINKIGDNKLTDEILMKSCVAGSFENEAIETLLKGKEIQLPDGYKFNDSDGNSRKDIRVKYWLQDAITYSDYFIGPASISKYIPNTPVDGSKMVHYSLDEKPLFIGHYWMDGDVAPLTKNIACVDYSVAKEGGRLVAYRWDGEQQIDAGKFVVVDR